MRHGLSGAGVVLPENLRMAVDRRRRAYARLFPPVHQLDVDDIDSAALGWARFLECRSERTHRAAHRAGLAVGHWATLRRMDAQERARRLAYDPPSVVSKLKLGLGGVHWLLDQWKMLKLALESSKTGEWSPKQQDRAQNLAGVDRLYRQDDPHRIRSGDVEDRRKLVEGQVAELQGLLADGELERLDEAARQDTILGTHALHDPAHDRLRLYEQRAYRTYERSIQRLADRHFDRHPELARPKRGGRRVVDREMLEELEARIDREIVGEEAEEAGALEIPADDELSKVEIHPVEIPQAAGRRDGIKTVEGLLRDLDAEKAAYVARLTDPEVLARVSDAEMKLIHPDTFAQVRTIIEEGGLEIDLDTAVRGILGRRRIEAERTGIPDPGIAALDRASARQEREQADRQRRQDDRDQQRQKRKDARKARKRNRTR